MILFINPGVTLALQLGVEEKHGSLAQAFGFCSAGLYCESRKDSPECLPIGPAKQKFRKPSRNKNAPPRGPQPIGEQKLLLP
jgi:hypothetical protein